MDPTTRGKKRMSNTGMGKVALLAIVVSIGFGLGCQDGGGSGSGNGGNGAVDCKQEMRLFVQSISAYARGIDPDFAIIPQNGQELLTQEGEETGTAAVAYIAAINGVGREDLYYGYDGDNVITPTDERDYMISFLDIARTNSLVVLVTDYCSDQVNVDNSYAWNEAKGYISFAADHRELDNIPAYPVAPNNSNADNVIFLSQVKNFLYLINPESFDSKEDFLNAIQATNYDLVLIDLFFNGEELTSADIASLKTKYNGGTRLVISYMSIGEAEDYRYYWDASWYTTPPDWMAEENPDWPGNYKVRYWDTSWQAIIYGNDSSYLGKILKAGFDGVYLDIIDAFEYFEGQ
jgi:cysteinyl-tRNA synthetase